MTLINHSTGGFLYSKIPKRFIPTFPTCRTSKLQYMSPLNRHPAKRCQKEPRKHPSPSYAKKVSVSSEHGPTTCRMSLSHALLSRVRAAGSNPREEMESDDTEAAEESPAWKPSQGVALSDGIWGNSGARAREGPSGSWD